MKILVAGDYCDRYRVSEIISEGRYDEMFGYVKPLIDDADFRFVNFEFPVVQKVGFPIPKCGPNLMGQAKSVDAIKYAGFNVCTLANNHILDQGETCCIDTINLIQQAGIQTVGAGGNLSEAEKILYLPLNQETLAVINCCEHEFSIATDNSAGANPLNPIKQFYKIQEARKNADYVLVIVHGGHEHYQLPSLRMRETYRFFIDAGADAVVNHHQHCYSGYEVYNGKPIFYGLGNFLFDHPEKRNTIWNEGYLVQLNFEKQGVSYKLHPYYQCNERPSVTLPQDDEVRCFVNRVHELNAVISNEKVLEKYNKEYFEKGKDIELYLLRPYHNRVLNKLFKLGFLPDPLKKSKYAILNHITCESHISKLQYALESLDKK